MTPSELLSDLQTAHESIQKHITTVQGCTTARISHIDHRFSNVTFIRNVGLETCVVRDNKTGKLAIDHTYLNAYGYITAHDAEEMAWELFAAVDEIRRIEQEKSGE